MRIASDAVSAERKESRRQMRSSSSGSIARLASAVIEHEQRDLQRDHAPVDERLDRQVALPEGPEVAQAREDGQPFARDEHVDEHDRQPTISGGAQRARAARARLRRRRRRASTASDSAASTSGW